MIFFVDEDSAAFSAWILELELRGFGVRSIRNANDAFHALAMASRDTVKLVVIDVMLAVGDTHDSRFSMERTDDYLETGLCLLEDLCSENPSVFPQRAVLLTNTSNATTLGAAHSASRRLKVPLWSKSQIDSPVHFGELVTQRVDENLKET